MVNRYNVMKGNANGNNRTYLRDCGSPQNVKNKLYYMIDSTYTVPSDPNSMRDCGPTRNAEYRLYDPIDDQVRGISSSKSSRGAGKTLNNLKASSDKMSQRSQFSRPLSVVSGVHRYSNIALR